jgi:cyclophilin family peptidyl-prolyl cis-trans isomerase
MKELSRKSILLLSFWAVVGAILIIGCKEQPQGVKRIEHAPLPPSQPEENKTMEKPQSSPAPDATSPPRVMLQTTMGDIIIELNPTAAPVTSENFLRYVKEGFYDGVIFHRVIAGFMIQSGGFTPDMQQKKTHAQIVNEASNGLKNLRGTLAMARTSDPHSASSQFFINHRDNAALDYGSPTSPDGYAVFAKVVEGMDIVNKIAAVKTGNRAGHQNVPLEPVTIKKASVISTP